jgi:prepilin-type N-terminal cleavage/methylation domain-containing protein
MNNLKNNQKKGFTLLEVVLVMFIVAVAFTGIYVVLAKNSEHEKDNRYSLIAANLAQEGVEIIRNKRDENILEGISLNSDLASGHCRPYWDGSDPVCDNNRTVEMELDSDGVYRNCSSSGCTGSATIFERDCDVDSNSTQIVASCTVTWESPSLGTTKSVEVEAYLSNWQIN